MDVNKLTAMASRLSIPQLQQAMRDGSLPPYVGMPILQQKAKEAQAMKNAQGAAQPKPPTVAQQVEGEAQQANIEDMMRQRAAMMQGQMAGTGGISDMLRKPEPEAMAKGGEVKRFAVAGVVPGLTYQQALQIINNPTASPEQKAQAQQVIAQQSQPAPATPQPTQQPVAAPQVQPQGLTALYNDAIAQNPIVTAEQARKQREEYLGPNTGIASLREDVNKMKDEATKDKEQAGWMALMKAGLATMAGTSPYALTNIGQGAQAGVTDFMDAQKEYRKALEKQRDLSFKLDSAERQEKMDTFKYGEDSEKASRSANTALKIGQAKEENDTRLKEAELDLRKQSNAISAASAADNAAYHKGMLENNLYAEARALSEMQNKADELRAKGDEKGAQALERQRIIRAESLDMSNPSVYGQSNEYKIWNNTLTAYRSRANSIETQLGKARDANAYTDEEKAAKKANIEQLQQEKQNWDKKIEDHLANKPSESSSASITKPTTQPSTTADTTKPQAGQRSRTNAKGWNLMYSNGQYAYVNPNNPSEYEVVP